MDTIDIKKLDASLRRSVIILFHFSHNIIILEPKNDKLVRFYSSVRTSGSTKAQYGPFSSPSKTLKAHVRSHLIAAAARPARSLSVALGGWEADP